MNDFYEGQDNMVFLAVLTLVIIFGFFYYCDRIIPFLKSKNYIEMEIDRAMQDNDEEELLFWKKQLKKSYRILIPFTKK